MATSRPHLIADEIGELSQDALNWINSWGHDHKYSVYYSDNELYALMGLGCSALVLDDYRVAFWVCEHRHERSYKNLDDASGDINRWVLQGLL